tara:strand:- start:131 stop:415 length:285 start_codon:yes stop_codon:yes gene_type:complete
MFKKLKEVLSSTKKLTTEQEITAAKEAATAKNEPFVRVVKISFDKDKPSDGYFELDWNKVFVANLITNGYTGDSPEKIVDQWFTELCRGIAEEV